MTNKNIINDGSTTIEKGLYTESLFPEIKEYEDGINKNEIKTITIVKYIKDLDRKALAFYYSKNPNRRKTGKETILNKKYADLVYGYDHRVYSDNELLNGVLKKIAQEQISAIKKFLEAWDLQASGNDFALQSKLIEEIQLDIKEYKPRRLEKYDDEILILAKELTENQSIQNMVTNIENFGKIGAKDILDITINYSKKIKNSIQGILYDFTFDKYWYLYLIFSGMLVYNTPKVIDYFDGYNTSLVEFKQDLKNKYGPDSERQIKIIENKVFPIIAKYITKVNSQGEKIDYDDLSNSVLYYYTIFPKDSIITNIDESEELIIKDKDEKNNKRQSCLFLDIDNSEINSGIYSEDKESYKKEAKNNLEFDGRHKGSVDIDRGTKYKKEIITRTCEIGPVQLTNWGLGSSTDFVLEYLNHPDNLKRLKIMSEINAGTK